MPISSGKTPQQAYLPNTDPIGAQPDDKSRLVTKFAQAMMPLFAPGGEFEGQNPSDPEVAAKIAAKLPTEQTERLWSDRPQVENPTLKDRFIQALVPLGAALVGGATGGNEMALSGASAGLKELGQDEDTRLKYKRDIAAKQDAIKSEIVMKRLLAKEGADGINGRNKNRYIFDEAMDPDTRKVYFVKKDRESGKVDLVDSAGNLVPYSKDLYDRIRRTGGSSMSEIGPPSPPENASPAPAVAAPSFVEKDMAPPKDIKGKVGGASVNGITSGTMAPPPGVPKTLPKTVKAPAAASSAAQPPAPTPETQPVDIQTLGQVPENLTAQDYDGILKNFRQGLKYSTADMDAREKKYAADSEDVARRDGENDLDARQRVKNAQAQLGKIQKEKVDFARLVEQKIADINAKKLAAEAKAKRDSGASGDKIRPALERAQRDFRTRSEKFQSAIDASGRIDSLIDSVKKGNRTAASTLARQMFDAIGDKGVMTDQDLKLYSGSPDFASRINRMISAGIEGIKYTPQDLEDMKQLARLFKERGQEAMASRAENAVTGFDKIYPEYGFDKAWEAIAPGVKKGMKKSEAPAAADYDTMTDEQLDAEMKKKGLK